MSLTRIGFLLAALAWSPAAAAVDGSVGIDYSKNFEPRDPYMNIGLGLGQALTKEWRLALQQNFERNLVIDAERRELEVADTRLSLTFSPQSSSSQTPAFSWNAGWSLTLPLSPASRQNETITRLGASLGCGYKTLVDITASTFVSYQVNQYQTAASENGEGGDPLFHYGYGGSLGFSKSFFERLSLALSGTYRESRYEDVPYEGRGVPDLNYSLDQAYSLDLSFGSKLWENAELSLTLSQGRLLEQAGWVDYVIFDQSESTWSLSFSLGF
jgi:hypothetical protein